MIKNIIVISDQHFGCKFGLCPPDGIQLDEGGYYKPSALQRKTWEMWNIFWEDWVPRVTRNDPYVVVNNGAVLDGVHHKSVTQISHNLSDQSKLAYEVLAPIVEKCQGNYYHIRGTEAHVGSSAQEEERVAGALGAIPNEIGNHARWEMWTRIDGQLIHFAHHIGTTQSSGYESTAVYKEMVEAFNEAGRWNETPPNIIVRSHRHRQFETRISTSAGYGISLVTPGWQLKTPFVYRLASGRSSTPQIGGYLIRLGDEDGAYTRFKVFKVGRSKEVIL